MGNKVRWGLPAQAESLGTELFLKELFLLIILNWLQSASVQQVAGPSGFCSAGGRDSFYARRLPPVRFDFEAFSAPGANPYLGRSSPTIRRLVSGARSVRRSTV